MVRMHGIEIAISEDDARKIDALPHADQDRVWRALASAAERAKRWPAQFARAIGLRAAANLLPTIGNAKERIAIALIINRGSVPMMSQIKAAQDAPYKVRRMGVIS